MKHRNLRRGLSRPFAIAILTGSILAVVAGTALADPTISGSPDGPLGPGGWYRQTSQIDWSVGFDPGWVSWPPQPASEPASPGTHAYDSGAACETNDGGTTVACNPGISPTFSVDNTPPVVGAGQPDRAPDSNGWYRSPVTMNFPCSDALSGILGGCPAVVVSGNGSSLSAPPRTVSDLAGNKSTSPPSASVAMDQLAPTVAISNPQAITYQYGAPVTSAFTCADQTGLSGLAGPCSGGTSSLLLLPLTTPVTLDPSATPDAVGIGGPVPTTPGGRDRSFVVSAADVAGNVGIGQVTYKVAPAVAGLSQPASATALRKPLYTWSNSPDSFITKYDVYVDSQRITPGAGVAPGAGGPPGYTSFQYTGTDLAIGSHSWYVKTTGQNGATSMTPTRSFTVDPRTPAAPQITGGRVGATNNATPAFSWASPVAGATFHWKVVPTGVADDAVPWQTTNGTQASASLGEGSYTFLVNQTDPANGLTGDEASLSFTVDLSAPAAPTITGGPGAATGNGTPSFSWTGEPGGTFIWSVVGPGGVVRSGALDGTNVTILPGLDLGAWTFQVQQRDAAGNIGAASVYAFTINPPPPPAPAPQVSKATIIGAKTKRSTSVLTPHTLNARFLLPKAGARITNLRPVLRWKLRPKGVKIYNLQIFRNSRKILSRFPTGQTFRVPKGTFKPGTRYIWRIWPYFGSKRGYSAKPLGLSYLDTIAVKVKKGTTKR